MAQWEVSDSSRRDQSQLITLRSLKPFYVKNANAYEWLKARLCARGFTYIILFNPPTDSARFFVFYFTDEERELSNIKWVAGGHADGDRDTGNQTLAGVLPGPTFFHQTPLLRTDWGDEVIRCVWNLGSHHCQVILGLVLG